MKLHLPKKGKQKCCCCKQIVEQDDLELWICTEMLPVKDEEQNTVAWHKTGSQELHTLCSNCVHRMDSEICKPVNRILGIDDEEEPPTHRSDQVV